MIQLVDNRIHFDSNKYIMLASYLSAITQGYSMETIGAVIDILSRFEHDFRAIKKGEYLYISSGESETIVLSVNPEHAICLIIDDSDINKEIIQEHPEYQTAFDKNDIYNILKIQSDVIFYSNTQLKTKEFIEDLTKNFVGIKYRTVSDFYNQMKL